MKFDEWGFRKYKPNNRLQRSTVRPRKVAQLARSTSSISSSESSPSPPANLIPEAEIKFGPHITVPARPLKLSELLPLIQGRLADEFALQALITKWQEGGEYMECARSFLRDPFRYLGSRGIDYIPTTGRALFSLIHVYVPYVEQFPLTKALLEADLSLEYEIYPSNDTWIRSWRSASVAETWGNAKRALSSVFAAQSPGKGPAQMFLDSALVVQAERLLKKYMDRLEGFRSRTGPLSCSDTTNAEHCRRQYLAILKDFDHTNLDLSSSWYKYFLRIVDWGPAMAENCQKHRKLISLYTDVTEEYVDEALNSLIENATNLPTRDLSDWDYLEWKDSQETTLPISWDYGMMET